MVETLKRCYQVSYTLSNRICRTKGIGQTPGWNCIPPGPISESGGSVPVLAATENLLEDTGEILEGLSSLALEARSVHDRQPPRRDLRELYR